MSNIIFLSLDEIVAIHYDQINRYGGSHGIRDLNLLLSAISRPQATFGGLDLYLSVFEKAAALIYSLVQNHPFVDGNKRTAVTATSRFLYVNGFELQFPNKELVKLPLKIGTGKLETNNIAVWLQKHSKKI